MGKYQSLFNYMSYFETLSYDEACRRDGGGFPIYDKGLTDFIHEVYETDLLAADYIATLEDSGILISGTLDEAIDSADFELVRAILTYYVRQERFWDGLWGLAVRDGVFYRLLKRLLQLEQESERTSHIIPDQIWNGSKTIP